MAKENRSEADIIFTLFSKEFGRIEVLGKAIRKINSKLRSACEVFNLSEITFIQGKNQKTLTDATLLNNFSVLKANPEALSVLAKMSQLLVDFTSQEERDPASWHLLKETLTAIDKLKANYFLISQYFIWNLFKLSGFLPQVYVCCVCSKKLLPEVLFFCQEEGGVLCWQCKNKIESAKQAKEISVNVIKIIRFLTENSLEKVLKLKIGKKDFAILEEIAGLVAKPA